MLLPAVASSSPREARVFGRKFPSWWIGALVVVAGSVVGCGDDERRGEARELATLEALEPVDAADDPFVSERPSVVDCNPLTGWYAEDEGLEVNTAHCNYASLGEPSLSAIRRGEIVSGSLSYFDLTAEAAAVAHVAVTVGDWIVFEREVDIPGPGDVIEFEVEAPADVAQGELVVFHLHNHGQNTWNFEALHVR